jgi:hypothetical protein
MSWNQHIYPVLSVLGLKLVTRYSISTAALQSHLFLFVAPNHTSATKAREGQLGTEIAK